MLTPFEEFFVHYVAYPLGYSLLAYTVFCGGMVVVCFGYHMVAKTWLHERYRIGAVVVAFVSPLGIGFSYMMLYVLAFKPILSTWLSETYAFGFSCWTGLVCSLIQYGLLYEYDRLHSVNEPGHIRFFRSIFRI
jgi:hypothetical protein